MITPLGNHLIVKRLPQVQIGSIIIPESSLDDLNLSGPKLWMVVATGPGRRTKKGVLLPMECEPGDRVICESYTTGVADVVLPDGERIMTADQILMVIPNAP